MVTMGNQRDVDVAYIGDSQHDDAVLVQIDTGDRTKRLRVYVNEGVVFDRDPEAGTPTNEEEHFVVTAFTRISRLEADAKQLSIDLGDIRGDLSRRATQLGIKL